MEVILDTANLDEIRHFVDYYPLSGVTTNPSILSKEHDPDFWGRLEKIKDIIGSRSLHVQVTAMNSEGMLEEAETIVNRLGKDTYIKIPVNEEGLKTIRIAHKDGYCLTATAIYFAHQGMLAIAAGADCLAPYYNRICNLNIDANKVIHDLSQLIKIQQCSTRIVVASFRNVGQVMNALLSGADAVTASASIYRDMVQSPIIEDTIEKFSQDWSKTYGTMQIT